MPQFWPTIPIKVLAGSASVPIVNAGSVSSTISVTFATPFATAPLVTASATNVRLTVEVSGSTTTGATFKVANWSPAATSASSLINWVAVGI